MQDIRHGELDGLDLAGRERHTLIEALPVAAAEGLAAHELLVAAHLHASGIRIRIREVVRIDIDELDDEIGIGAGGGGVEDGLDRAGDGQVFLEHIAFVDQHIGALRGEALIGDHVVARHAQLNGVEIGHGTAGIADVFIDGVVVGRSFKGELAAGAEVERLLARLLGRPGVKAAPLIRAGLE